MQALQSARAPPLALSTGTRLSARPAARSLRHLRPTKSVQGTPAAAAASAAAPPPQWANSLESRRKELRSVFDTNRWELHRDPSRYIRHLVGIGRSRLLHGLAQPLLVVTGLAAAVCGWGWALGAGILPAGAPAPAVPGCSHFFTLTSFALALLLVFRTNASYGRWDEARKFFGLVLNRSREMTRLAITYVPQRPLREMLVRWVPAYSRALMCHLRKGEDLEQELQGILLPHEIKAVLGAVHRPNYVLQVLGQLVREANLQAGPQLRFEDHLTACADCLGGCERILRTPIPLFYTRHTSRFLMIWLCLLPFLLLPACGWVTVPMTTTIAFLLLGIDKIGVSIEEPHSILAYEAICDSILASVRELHAMHDPPAHTSGSGSGNGNGMEPAVPAAVLVEAGMQHALA